MTDPYCATTADACRNTHCIVCRNADSKPYVTVQELLARFGMNRRILETYVDKIQPKPSPIVIGRFGVSA